MIATILTIAATATVITLLVVLWRAARIFIRFSRHETLRPHRTNAFRLQLGRDLAVIGLRVASSPIWLPAFIVLLISFPFWWVHENLVVSRLPFADRINSLSRRIDVWTHERNQPLIAVWREVQGPRRGLASVVEET